MSAAPDPKESTLPGIPRKKESEFWLCFVPLFVAVNAIGVLPLFVSLTEETDAARRRGIVLQSVTVGRAVFEPGWRRSTSMQPLAKTKSCEAPHFQYRVSGVLRVVMDDGAELDCKAGDVSLLSSGHDARVVGNEPAVVADFQGMLDYARAR